MDTLIQFFKDPQAPDFQLSMFSFWVFIISCPFAIGFSSYIIYTFFKYPTCREQPGDIILGISLSDFVLSIHWFITALFSAHGPFSNTVDPGTNSSFCQINAIFSTAAGINSFLYNTSFCLVNILIIKNALKSSKMHKKIFHIVNICIMLSMVIYMKLSGKLGLTALGTCSVSSIGLETFIPIGLYLTLSCYT